MMVPIDVLYVSCVCRFIFVLLSFAKVLGRLNCELNIYDLGYSSILRTGGDVCIATFATPGAHIY